MSSLNVCTILGDRLDLSSLQDKSTGAERVVRTQSGREIRAELVLLCTGQTPNTTLLGESFPDVVVQDGPNKGMARVRRTLQLAAPLAGSHEEPTLPAEVFAAPEPASEAPTTPAVERELAEPSSSQVAEALAEAEEEELEGEEEEEPEPIEEDPYTRVAAEHIFAIGDAADAFGAVNAGHNAFFQGEVAARNILKLVKRAEHESESRERLLQQLPFAPYAPHAPSAPTEAAADEDLELQKYVPGAPAIKVSLGLTKSVYQFQGMIGIRDKEPADLDVHLIWRYFGHNVTREDLEADPDVGAAEPKAVTA